MEESPQQNNSNLSIDFTLNDVIGPIFVEDSLPQSTINQMIGNTFDIFVPFSSLSDFLYKKKPLSISGTNVYPGNSSLPQIAIHQGVIFNVLNSAEAPTNEIATAKLINIYDPEYNLVKSSVAQIRNARSISRLQIYGVELIIQITPPTSKFVGTYLNGFKTRTSTKSPIPSIAVLFGQPIFQPINFFDSSYLPFVLKVQPIYYSIPCLTFALTGDPIEVYDYNIFDDVGKLEADWSFFRFKKQCLYLESATYRYELTLISAPSISSFRFSRLRFPLMSRLEQRNVPSPMKLANVFILQEGLMYNEICFGKDFIKVRDTVYDSIYGMFWTTRHRPISDKY